MQKKMVADVSAKYGLSISTGVLQAGHSPYLSKPSELLVAVENQLRQTIQVSIEPIASIMACLMKILSDYPLRYIIHSDYHRCVVRLVVCKVW